MTAKESKAVAWRYVRVVPGPTGGNYYDVQFSQCRWTADYLTAHGATEEPLVPESALHAAEAELGELRRAARDYMEASETWQQALRDGINVHGAISGFIGAQDNLDQLLASDGGADGEEG